MVGVVGFEPTISSFFMVGAERFELSTFRTQTGRATKLRYAPIMKNARDRGGSVALGISKAPQEPSILSGPCLAPKQAPSGGRRCSAALITSGVPPEPPIPKGPLFAQTRHTPIKVQNGGAEGVRTPDLIVANDALSQLSYSPTCSDGRGDRT